MRTSHWYTINTKVVNIHINYPTITPKPNTTVDHLNKLCKRLESHSKATWPLRACEVAREDRLQLRSSLLLQHTRILLRGRLQVLSVFDAGEEAFTLQ
jgi:hypothetical protein